MKSYYCSMPFSHMMLYNVIKLIGSFEEVPQMIRAATDLPPDTSKNGDFGNIFGMGRVR